MATAANVDNAGVPPIVVQSSPMLTPEQADIEREIGKVQSELSQETQGRLVRYGLPMLIAVIICVAALAAYSPDVPDPRLQLAQSVVAFFPFVAVIGYYFLDYSHIHTLESKLRLLNVQKQLARLTLPKVRDDQSPQARYYDNLVKINLNNLQAYYELVKIHTDRSFMTSIVAGGSGFLIILMGLSLGFSKSGNSQSVTYVASASGIAVEFISGVFFYLYNRTVHQLKEYHDSLLSVQDIIMALQIVSELPEASDKTSLLSQIAVHLVAGRRSANYAASAPSQEGATVTAAANVRG